MRTFVLVLMLKVTVKVEGFLSEERNLKFLIFLSLFVVELWATHFSLHYKRHGRASANVNRSYKDLTGPWEPVRAISKG
jgi:hypothetical protein